MSGSRAGALLAWVGTAAGGAAGDSAGASVPRRGSSKRKPGDRVRIYSNYGPHTLKFFTEFYPELQAEESPLEDIPEGQSFWAVYSMFADKNLKVVNLKLLGLTYDDFEVALRGHNCRFERIPISAGSYTFVYTTYAILLPHDIGPLVLYPTTLYRIRPAAETAR